MAERAWHATATLETLRGQLVIDQGPRIGIDMRQQSLAGGRAPGRAAAVLAMTAVRGRCHVQITERATDLHALLQRREQHALADQPAHQRGRLAVERGQVVAAAPTLGGMPLGAPGAMPPPACAPMAWLVSSFCNRSV